MVTVSPILKRVREELTTAGGLIFEKMFRIMFAPCSKLLMGEVFRLCL